MADAARDDLIAAVLGIPIASSHPDRIFNATQEAQHLARGLLEADPGTPCSTCYLTLRDQADGERGCPECDRGL